jgi:hypothetical protein
MNNVNNVQKRPDCDNLCTDALNALKWIELSNRNSCMVIYGFQGFLTVELPALIATVPVLAF